MSIHDPIIRSILSRFVDHEDERVGNHARAVIVLDVELSALKEPLLEANYLVIVGQGLNDFERRRQVLSGRVLITANSPDYIDDAPIMEFGIIGLDAMPCSTSAAPLPDNETTRMISNAFIDHDLGRERGSYLLLLHESGHHVFRRLC